MKNFKVYVFLVVTILAFGTLLNCGKLFNSSESNSEEPLVVRYTVTFDYNDGSGKTEAVKIPEGHTIDMYAPYPISDTQYVVGWSGVQGGSDYSAPITSDVTLYARWEQIVEVVFSVEDSSSLPSQISDRFVAINVLAVEGLEGKTLRIGSSVQKVTISSESLNVNNFSILINSRATNLNLALKNISFTGYNGFGIKGDSSGYEYSVNLEIHGTVMIDCKNVIGVENDRAADCINVPNLNVRGSGALILYGGNGLNGDDKSTAADGCDGEYGGKGQDGGYGIVAQNVTVERTELVICGGNGGNGGYGGTGNNGGGLTGAKYKSGGDGGKGGNGGGCVLAESFSVGNSTITLVGGNGGNGGTGGNGGGSSSTYAGYGGNGGNGGAGGDVFSYRINYNEINVIKSYTGGNGGVGGSGGYSASASKHGVGGNNGAQGDINV